MGQGMLRASNGASEGRGPASGETSRDDPVESWSLGGPSVEAVTSETGPLKKVLERRMR